jgi:hypothetical protein
MNLCGIHLYFPGARNSRQNEPLWYSPGVRDRLHLVIFAWSYTVERMLPGQGIHLYSSGAIDKMLPGHGIHLYSSGAIDRMLPGQGIHLYSLEAIDRMFPGHSIHLYSSGAINRIQPRM